jgi:hypothetical protein
MAAAAAPGALGAAAASGKALPGAQFAGHPPHFTVSDAASPGQSDDASWGKWVVLLLIAALVGAGVIGVWVWVLNSGMHGGVRKPYMYAHGPAHDDPAFRQQSFNVMMPGVPDGFGGYYQPQMAGTAANMVGPMGPMGPMGPTGYNSLPQQGMVGLPPGMQPYSAPPTVPSLGPGGPYGHPPLY